MITLGFKYCKRLIFAVSILVVISLINAALLFVMPFLSRIIYDRLLTTHDHYLMIQILFCLAGFIVVNILANNIIVLITMYIRQRIIEFLRVDIMRSLMQYPFSFYREVNHGELFQRIVGDVDAVAGTIAQFMQAGAQVLQLIILLGTILLLDREIFILFILAMVAYLIWMYIIRIPLSKSDSNIKRVVEDLYSHFLEYVHAMKQIKVFGLFKKQETFFVTELNNLKRRSIQRSMMSMISNQGQQIGRFLSLSLLVICFYKIIEGEMTIGQYIMFGALTGLFISPVSFMFGLFENYESGNVSFKRIKGVLGLPHELSGPVLFTGMTTELVFDHITFKYNKDAVPAIDNITLVIKQGTHVAIVGESGSGKSTLVNLLMGIYQPTEGALYLNNMAITNYDIESLRKNIGVFSQDTFLFNTSVRDCINPKGVYSDDQIREALTIVRLPEFVGNLEYQIGEKGCRLSGGERQRIALARIVIRDCDIVILDEATSNLDPKVADEILDTLKGIHKENPHKTFITITHNWRELRNVDYVYMLKQGAVINEGTSDILEMEK